MKFSRETFGVHSPYKHLEHTGPYKSHEYVKDYLKALYLDERGFVVGTHQDNISTVFDHPYAGYEYLGDNVTAIVQQFGLDGSTFKPPFSVRRVLFNKLPYRVKRKLRFLAGEKKWILRPIFRIVYNFLRA